MKKFITFFLFSSLLSPCFSQENSLLWAITKPESKDTSFLFGSIHVSDPQVFNVNKHFNRVFEKSNLVALELNMDSINPFKMLNYIMMDSSLTLKKIMSPNNYAVVKKYFEENLGQPIQFVERFQPIYTSTILQAGTGEEAKSGKSLDETIFNNAKANGKKVIGLETAEEQMAAFSSFPYRVQAKMLYQTVMEIQKNANENSIDKLIELYIKQDLSGLEEEINKVAISEDKSMQEFALILNEKLIVKRNQVMLERSLPLIQSNKTLIVVGAAHLPGNNGLIELYRKAGYLVSPIK